MNAHRINAGKTPDISNGRASDFFFMDVEKQLQDKGIETDDSSVFAEEAATTIVGLVKQKLATYYRTPSSEIQVLQLF